VRIDRSAVLFLVGCIFRKGGLCDFIKASEGGRKRVVVVIDANDFVFACLLESENDVRAFRERQQPVGGGDEQREPM
jgi:hypothetical protein